MTKRNVTATVGATFLSGNSMRPDHDTVTAIVGWAQLPAKERKAWRTIQYWYAQETLEAAEYVLYTNDRGRKSSSPRDVFEATRYETHDAMIDAYLSPGERAAS